MINKGFKLTKVACYSAYFTMSSIFTLPPILFVTFHNDYGISYTLLGTLVLANFCTQLTVDLIFTIFTKYFDINKIIRIMPLITSFGLIIYAFSPLLFPKRVFIGLLLGTIIFSVSAGLSEVLLSPVIAAIPSDNSQRDMSMLHSLYAFGVFSVVLISTLFFRVFGNEKWMYLTMLFAALPIIASILFMISPMPDMAVPSKSKVVKMERRVCAGLAFCGSCIFFGSCAENVMSNWISGYIENALNIDKSFGDILGMAMFAVLLGVSRILYAKYGKNIAVVLLLGMIGSSMCYIIAGVSLNSVVSLVACVLIGLFTAMLWPGSLILMEDNLPGIGVTAYALLASCGDLGASFAPQLMGIIVDEVSEGKLARQLALRLGITTEQIGMKCGLLISSIFPIIGVLIVICATNYFKKTKKKE